MVEVQQHAFATVEETEAEKIVVDERCEWTQDDVDHAEPYFAIALRHDHLRAQRRVAVNVLDVVGERGVGVVKERSRLNSSAKSFDMNVFMDCAILELAASATEQSQLWIGPVAAVPDPTTEEFIFPRYPQAAEVGADVEPRISNRRRMITRFLAQSRQAVEGCQQFVQGLLQLEVEFLIGIQTQNQIGRAH